MLPPGSTVGILGVGQLGRMLASAATKLGFHAAAYGPGAVRSPAGMAAKPFEGDYLDVDAVTTFAKRCDVVTYEFENVPAETAAAVAASGTPLAPNAEALAASQERLREKTLFRDLGIGTVPFWQVDSADDLRTALAEAGPSIAKTRRFGYDGKGQARLTGSEDADAVWRELGEAPLLLEGFASFEREVSLIAARARSGDIAFFDLCENHHEGGILARSMIPAQADDRLVQQARQASKAILERLNYVGVLTVEFFVTKDGLLANEMAPRVHNSGHHTLEACSVSQFEQHIRAVTGWPLRPAATLRPSELLNLIGDQVNGWEKLVAEPGTDLTLYGKAEARPGRKMGHMVRPL
ncbi:5-(carboxyamino)imidazole ribonucleotide synthase [Parvularcula maris]|uniref:N5-carboxyaminoimidazole ribonucleotide synthase n=1 Tax=Parvularcula maris TaxID=2965077 RepID=A0A9X2LBB0_9PROT|nr:5-(carboxyamino)imidazole ribonucleotide synthase [Parvularcula maris]MCQ8186578.1 5-(carboxyamino)imidazole ribonucleotide synthase [Parvularcula maris]